MATCASPASSKLTSLLSVEFARFGDRLYLREVLNPFKSLWSRASFSSNCAVSSMVLVIFLAKQEVRSFSGTFAVSFTVYTQLRVITLWSRWSLQLFNFIFWYGCFSLYRWIILYKWIWLMLSGFIHVSSLQNFILCPHDERLVRVLAEKSVSF